MINSIDQTTDFSNRELYQYLSGINLPEFVKNASFDDVVGNESLPKTAFADPVGRHYPMNTPARIYVSAAHFLNKCGELAKIRGNRYTEKVADQLDLAAGIFGIRSEISDLTKIALLRDDEDYTDRSVVFRITNKTAGHDKNLLGRSWDTKSKFPREAYLKPGESGYDPKHSHYDDEGSWVGDVTAHESSEYWQARSKGLKKESEADIVLFTVKTAQDLENASNTFVENIHKYPFEWRRGIADQFVKAAESLDVDELPALVLKYAGQYYPNIVDVKQELQRRMTKLSATDQKRYASLIGDVNNISDKEEVFKLAECCHYTEKTAGLYDKPQMRRILGDPVDQLFTMHFDKVAAALDVVEMGGERFASEDLEKISSDIYYQAFGFKLDPKSAEAKDILPTMPKSDVSLFKQLSGVKPI